MLVCTKCNSEDVHMLAWVDANSRQFVEWHDGAEMGWCVSCGAQVDVKYLPTDWYNKKKAKSEEEESGRAVDNSAGSDS